MLKHNNFNKKHIVVVLGLLLVVAALVTGLLVGRDDSIVQEAADIEVETKTTAVGEVKVLQEDEEEAQRQQDAANAQAEVDISNFTPEELYAHYLAIAESLVISTDYTLAAENYGKAGEAFPENYFVFVTQAETYILDGDSLNANIAYNAALKAYQDSGLEGYDAYEQFIQSEIAKLDAAFDGTENNQ